MKTKKKMLTLCQEGDILAEDIYGPYGVPIVIKDTEMNLYIINKLMNRGIRDVCVYVPAGDNSVAFQKFSYLYKEGIILIKRLINHISAGKKLDYVNILQITNLILSSTRDNKLILQCLSDLSHKDEYTYTHCINVAFYSLLIGKWLNLGEEGIWKVIQAGLLHDIGKAKIHPDILNKKGRLTPAEYELIKKHTVIGYELVKGITGLDEDVKKAILLHHERVDASGYPFRYSQDNINLYAKIVAVADVFDAMTSDRVYKQKVTPFEAFEMFKQIGVGIFDIAVLNVFLRNMAIYYTGTKVLLNTGEVGEIVYIPPQDILSPVIQAPLKTYDLSKDKVQIVNFL